MIVTAIALAIVGAPGVPGTAIPSLAFPVACQIGRTCEVQNYVDRDPGGGAKDYRCGHETYQDHNGVDIRLLDLAAQKRGVAVLAAAPGKVLRLRDSMPDVSVKDPSAPALKGQDCGNGVIIDHGGGWETQYCHMAQGSISVKAGQKVAAGAPLGRVGLSGNTEYPHVHVTVRHDGKVVDPFDPDGAGLAACRMSHPLWSPAALAQLAYKQGAVLNTGFAAGPVKPKDIEAGQIARPDPAADYLVAYGRAIDLQAGDVIGLELRAPGGAVLAKNSLPPITGPEAQHMAYIGVKRPPAGWTSGVYKARFTVTRQGKTALVREFETRL
jgi:hypothetical protein